MTGQDATRKLGDLAEIHLPSDCADPSHAWNAPAVWAENGETETEGWFCLDGSGLWWHDAAAFVRPLRLVPDEPPTDLVLTIRQHLRPSNWHPSELDGEIAERWYDKLAYSVARAVADQSPLPPRDVLDRATLLIAADEAESLCHWLQGRGQAPGDPRRQSHREFHFGNPCPYEVVAAVLRGESDPRDAASEPNQSPPVDLAEVRARVLAIPAGSYRRDLGFDAAISRVLHELDEIISGSSESAMPEHAAGCGRPGWCSNLQCRCRCHYEGAETAAAPSSGTGTPAEAVSGGSGDAERQDDRLETLRDALAYLSGPGAKDKWLDRTADVVRLAPLMLQEVERLTAEVARLTEALAESERERTEVFAEAMAGHREAQKIISDQAREVARYRAAVQVGDFWPAVGHHSWRCAEALLKLTRWDEWVSWNWPRQDEEIGRIICTGAEAPEGGRYVNTVLVNGGRFVFHVFEVLPVPSTGETT